MRRSIAGLAALTAATLLFTGCSSVGGASDDATDGSDPIKVAIVYGLTGAYAGTGATFMLGFNATVDDINANGGIDGRQIEVTLIDDKSDPTFAVSALTELLDSGYEPDAIIPGGVSTEALALLPLTTDAEIFSVSPATSPATNDSSLYPYHFGDSATVIDQLRTYEDEWKKDGVKRLGVVLPADAFGDSLLDGLKALAEDLGIEIVATERPDPTALNFDVEFQRLVAADPDGIFGDFAAFDAIARALTSRDTVGATDIPYYVGTGTVSATPSTLADASALEGCYMPAFNFQVKQADPPADLKPLYDAFMGENASIYPGALGHDAVRLIALAIERSDGDTSGAALTDALTSDDIEGDLLADFRTGTSFSDDDRFPALFPGSMSIVPCSATLADGLLVVD